MKYTRSMAVLLMLFSVCISLSAAKIVGLVAARNEQIMIAQCLQGLATICDAIVVLDDASDDNTRFIVESLAIECKIERIIKKDHWY